MKNKLKKVIAGTLFATTCLAVPAFASNEANINERGYTYRSFSTTVGKVNGNGYTGFQTKEVSGANAQVKKFANGGYKADIRMIDRDGSNGTWTRQKSSGSFSVDGHKSHIKGEGVRLQISNNSTTLKDTQASGEWQSN